MTEAGKAERSADVDRQAPNPFSPVSSAAIAALWLLVMLQGWGARIGGDPTAWLSDPANTAARVVNRDLERAEANRQAGLGRELRSAVYGSFEDVLEVSISIQRDAAAVVAARVEIGDAAPGELARANARLRVLLATAGEPAGAFERADPSLRAAIEEARLAGAAAQEDWLLERAAMRLLEQSGERERAGARQIEERAARWQYRSDLLTAANLLLIAGGSLLLFAMACGRVRLRATAPHAIPWSLALGLAVLVRADVWNRLYFVALAQLGETLAHPEWLSPLHAWGTPIASLPLLWLVYRYLLAPARGPLLEPFGMHRGALRPGRIVSITAAALAIDLLGTTLLAWGCWGLGFEGHWAEGLDETLIWGTTREVIETCIDYLLWTPAFEELMFRGLLFATLRSRFGAFAAAGMSAALFGAVHFYSLPGFLMTFWSGFVWAISFDRARSLVPGILAHALYNLMFVAGILLIYR